jgi:hypothetical protein
LLSPKDKSRFPQADIKPKSKFRYLLISSMPSEVARRDWCRAEAVTQ